MDICCRIEKFEAAPTPLNKERQLPKRTHVRKLTLDPNFDWSKIEHDPPMRKFRRTDKELPTMSASFNDISVLGPVFHLPETERPDPHLV
jgi:hypothetical protein